MRKFAIEFPRSSITLNYTRVILIHTNDKFWRVGNEADDIDLNICSFDAIYRAKSYKSGRNNWDNSTCGL